MYYLYYCNSTYQLLNILNLHWHRNNGFESIDDYRADLIIQNSFDGADKIVEIIRKENIFENTVLIDKTYNNGALHKIQTLLDIFSPSLYMKTKHGIRRSEIANHYDVLCAPKYTILVDQIWRLNKRAQLHLIEDGIGSYHLNLPFEPKSSMYRKVRNFLKCNRFEDYKYLYLVNRNMFLGKNEDRVVELPKFNKEYLNYVRTLFVPFYTGYEEKDIYWLSQFLNNEKFNKMVAEILEYLAEYKEDVLFCQHPRTPMPNIHGFAQTDGRQIWELQVLSMNNISKKLFVSIHSTACFSAKMLFDEEPYIIMFYKMGDKVVTHATDNFELAVNRFISSYKNPEKVMLPESMDELKNCIKKYVKEVLSLH